MRGALLRAIFASTALGLITLYAFRWSYLRGGYGISVGLEDGAAALHTHIVFPVWRLVAHIAIAALIAVSAWLVVFRNRPSVLVQGTATGAALVVGGWDVYEYGTLASPTTLVSTVLVVLLYLGVRVMRRSGPAGLTA